MTSLFTVTALQTDIVWQDKHANLERLQRQLEALAGQTDLIVLPETFSTGFSMETARLAEPADGGETTARLREWAARYGCAIAGSFIATEPMATGRTAEPKTLSYRNRAFLHTPEGTSHYCDKRHLFRMGGETEAFTAGRECPVIRYRGCRIQLLVCYDLRFPVWSRNVGNRYDLLVYVANWPASRRAVWDTLLRARALENQCYVCGVNRTGTDGNGLAYDGGTVIHSPYGKPLAAVADGREGSCTAALDLEALERFRQKFPVWMDADGFDLR